MTRTHSARNLLVRLMSETPWSRPGSPPPTELTSARLAAHYAAQPLAAAAYALLPMEADHSHSNLLWSADQDRFLGRELPRGGKCFLDVKRLAVGLISGNGATVSIELAGKTLAFAMDGMAEILREVGEEVPAKGLALPEYDLPPAPVATGATFDTFEDLRDGLAELERWIRGGAGILAQIADRELDGVELRGWPHHFDLAAFRVVDDGGDPETARSINVGLSPGDSTFNEPYFYVGPWPYPNPGELPELPGGARWHTEGFTAAVLTATSLLANGSDPLETLVGTVRATKALMTS